VGVYGKLRSEHRNLLFRKYPSLTLACLFLPVPAAAIKHFKNVIPQAVSFSWRSDFYVKFGGVFGKYLLSGVGQIWRLASLYANGEIL